MTKRGKRILALATLSVCVAGGAVALVVLHQSPRDRITQYLLLIHDTAAQFDVEPNLVSAIILAESGGWSGAVSPKGARGLMQLMPDTAKETAGKLGKPAPTIFELLEPATNIELGVCYLAQLQRDFSGDTVLAVAAYNAGPSRVRDWLRKGRGLSAGEIIKKYAFDETRKYVERVLKYKADLDGG